VPLGRLHDVRAAGRSPIARNALPGFLPRRCVALSKCLPVDCRLGQGQVARWRRNPLASSTKPERKILRIPHFIRSVSYMGTIFPAHRPSTSQILLVLTAREISLSCVHFAVDRAKACVHIACTAAGWSDARHGDRQMTKAEIEANYDAANKAFNAAWSVYDDARTAFRAGKISSVDFVAARRAHDAALAVYDVAFAAMQNIDERAETVARRNALLAPRRAMRASQSSLFA